MDKVIYRSWWIFSYQRIGVLVEFNVAGCPLYQRVGRIRKINIQITWGK